ncbi:uncharacterized protein BDZ99DRAFT_463086 [Mytilinidion resinicola]|uniref:Uncharacterized protein n=1 Tax=Mytilinidion resinicola TaxID=574789 RepID=A0A6A6YNS1_9PEZI|nr:uncharacterized protein BDZ99DRAFT_463086 [Mytilinidion resinicola]KAF2810522.1 hypothetical protein BDZ99DRAFT_463086 [Mytilinidion resinicola]
MSPPPTIFNPNQCPECPFFSNSQTERSAHMDATSHNGCSSCSVFLVIGGLANHMWNKHFDEPWNDHAVEWTDKVRLQKKEEREKDEKEKGEREKKEGDKAGNKSHSSSL